MSRKDLGLSEKIAVLNCIDAEPHCSSRRLAEIMGISKSSILRIRRDEKRLRALWASENRRDVKRYRESKCPEVDEALRQWYHDLGPRGQSLSGSVLMKKAEQLALELGKNDFRATDGWLSRWKQRHSIKFKRSPADGSTINQWRALRLPECLQSFSADDIYNAAELSLFHRLEASTCHAVDTLSTLEKYRDRLTVLCCANMSGSDKRQLLIIGQSAEPICIDELKLENFQFLFHANNNARMTTPIFGSWLALWDEELQRLGKRALLLVDDCFPRPPRDKLKNIVFEFMPTNIISKIQPLSMGVIDSFKTLYNARMTEYLSQTSGPGSMAPSPELNLMQAALIAADSWKNVSETLIQDCFAQAGFKQELAFCRRTPEPCTDEAREPFTDGAPEPFTDETPESCTNETPEPFTDETPEPCADGARESCMDETPEPCTNETPSLISSGDSGGILECESWMPAAECLIDEEVVPVSALQDGKPNDASVSNQVPSSITSGNSEESPHRESWIAKTLKFEKHAAVPAEIPGHEENNFELKADQMPSFIAAGNSEEFAHCQSWIPRTGPEQYTDPIDNLRPSLTPGKSVVDFREDRKNPTDATVSTSEAIRCLEIVKRYFLQESDRACPTAELEKCIQFISKRKSDGS